MNFKCRYEIGAGAGSFTSTTGAGALTSTTGAELGAVGAESSYSYQAGTTGMATTTITITTTSQYNLGAVQTGENRSSVMGVTDATYDKAVDVTYSTKLDNVINTITNLNTITNITTRPVKITTRILKHIINNNVRLPIVSNTVVNPMVNNF